MKDIKLIQLTDMHLFGDTSKTLRGVNTFKQLQIVLQDIREKDFNADAIFVSGDISEDQTTDSYINFGKALDTLGLPSFWFAGNHDDFSRIPQELINKHVLPEVTLGNWKLIFLDTTIPKKDEGLLSFAELQRLSKFLIKHQNYHLLIGMHHPPIDVNSEFIDKLGLINKVDFWEVLNENNLPQAIVFGHVHQPIQIQKDNTLLISSPATSMQWIPESPNFAFSDNEVGYQLITLKTNGEVQCETIVLKVEN